MKYYLFSLTILLMFTSCNSKKTPQLASGIDLTNLNTSVSPKDDFYDFACGGWMKNNPLTGEYARFGAFDKLRENNLSQLKMLVEEIAEKSDNSDDNETKIGIVYRLAMNEKKLNEEGYAPIKSLLNDIALIQNKKEIFSLIPDLYLSGISSYFSIFVSADPMNSTQNLLQAQQSGLGLANRDYYLESGAMEEIREKYKIHIINMFQLMGFPIKDAEKNMKAVLEIETRLAKASFDKEKLRDPHSNYNKMSIKDLKTLIPQINWKNYFDVLGLNNLDEINIRQKEFFIELGKLIETESLENQKAYLQWKLINSAAPYLSDEIYAEHFDFYGTIISGKEEQQARWKRAVNSVDAVLGEVLGQVYVKKYFPSEAKERMLSLVENLQFALADRIDNSDWMEEETKAKAKEKLGTFYVKIGYPNTWRDYSGLIIKDDSYFDNIARANRFEKAHMFSKLGKPVDKDEWHMTPQTVNAYYNPTTNEICFPAGILQYPFFSMEADDAFNYGAIGVVIGHEMTHGFDDKGRQFDKDGNLKDWWSEEDGKRFEQRVKVLEDFFSAIEVAPGVFGNGKFTLGENLADYGGLEISFQAFQNARKDNPLSTIDGFTPEQRFFLAYSTVWANNIRPEEVLVRTKTDPHSLGKWRVNGALPQIEAWYKAFDIKEGDAMYVAPEKRVSIW